MKQRLKRLAIVLVIDVTLVLGLLLYAGCSLMVVRGVNDTTDVKFHVGAKDYPLIEGKASFVTGQTLDINSDPFNDLTLAARDALMGGGGLIVNIIETATEWAR